MGPRISSYMRLANLLPEFCADGRNVAKNEKAAPANRNGLLKFNPGGDLRSRAVSSAVSSAQRGLTSVFGMGTGVTLAVRPPGNWKSKLDGTPASFEQQPKEAV